MEWQQSPESGLVKRVSEKWSIFTGKLLCWIVIWIRWLWNFITRITLQHWCSPITLLHMFKISFHRNIVWWTSLAKGWNFALNVYSCKGWLLIFKIFYKKCQKMLNEAKWNIWVLQSSSLYNIDGNFFTYLYVTV